MVLRIQANNFFFYPLSLYVTDEKSKEAAVTADRNGRSSALVPLGHTTDLQRKICGSHRDVIWLDFFTFAFNFLLTFCRTLAARNAGPYTAGRGFLVNNFRLYGPYATIVHA
jgi:hypothetical protein